MLVGKKKKKSVVCRTTPKKKVRLWMGTKDASPVTPLLVFGIISSATYRCGGGKHDATTQYADRSTADQPREQTFNVGKQTTRYNIKGGSAASELTKITTALAPQKLSRVVD